VVDSVQALSGRFVDLTAALLQGRETQPSSGQPGGLRDRFSRAMTGAGLKVDVAAGMRDLVLRGTALGPQGRWIVAAANSGLATLAFKHRNYDAALSHLGGAVAAGYSNCVALNDPIFRPFWSDPRFTAIYGRMRISEADLDELLWLTREIQAMSRDATQASIDNIGRHDTGVSLLAQAPMPMREPQTAGVFVARLELLAVQRVLQQLAMNADISRSSGNVSLSLIDDSWDERRARRDSWEADRVERARQRAAEARAFRERPGAGRALMPCPPLGSVVV
jgi:hypothetical protein